METDQQNMMKVSQIDGRMRFIIMLEGISAAI
jgi:hypothetical protein